MIGANPVRPGQYGITSVGGTQTPPPPVMVPGAQTPATQTGAQTPRPTATTTGTQARPPVLDSRGQEFNSLAVTRGAQTPEQEAFYANLPTYYPGSTVAGLTEEQRLAHSMVLDNAAAQQATINRALQSALNPSTAPTVGTSARLNRGLDLALGELLEEGNPYLTSVVDNATRAITDNFTQAVLPQLGSVAQQSGAWGGSRQGVVEGLAAGQTAQAVGDTAAQLSLDAWNRALGTFEAGLGAEVAMRGQDVTQRGQTMSDATSRLSMVPGLTQASFLPAQMVDAVGADLRAYDQELINADIDRHQYGQTADVQRLAQYAQLLPGASTGTIQQTGTNSSTNTNTATTPRPSAVQSALGGAATGAFIGANSGIENGGTWGALLGLLGGLAAR